MQRDFLATINRFLHNDLYTAYITNIRLPLQVIQQESTSQDVLYL